MEELRSKKETAFEFLRENAGLFACPICSAPLFVREPFLACENGHAFSMPRKGVPVLMKTQLKKSRVYDTELFLNRRKIIMGGHYAPVYAQIAEFVQHCAAPRVLLDIGCGEGSHTKLIKQALGGGIKTLGFDISHDAISLASDYILSSAFFFVADATRVPLTDKSVDVIIDFLSPYQALETRRVLKDDGLFIKITPNAPYLHELRDALQISAYTGADDVMKTAGGHFSFVASARVTSTTKLCQAEREAAIKMSPLTKERATAALANEINELTIDLTVTLFKKEAL